MLGLWEKRDLPVGTYYKGMKQKISICRTLIHDPQVLFLYLASATFRREEILTKWK